MARRSWNCPCKSPTTVICLFGVSLRSVGCVCSVRVAVLRKVARASGVKSDFGFQGSTLHGGIAHSMSLM